MFNIVITDYMGQSSDLRFISDESWLHDTSVTANIVSYKGQWKIRLVFAWVKKPLQLICRYMPDSYSTKNKAETFANYFLKTTQKDKRGLLIINNYDFNICYN